MKTIQLTQGKMALVDDADFDELNRHKWCAHKDKRTFYAVRSITVGNGRKATLRMHRVIMGTPPDMEVDHKDHDGLNCQRYNLRNCTHQQNGMNRQIQSKKSASALKGVRWDKSRNKWLTEIIFNGKRKHLGRFITEKDAANAYNEGAIKYFGDFALLNSL